MKKLIAIAGTGILLMMAASVAQSHTWLAKYQDNGNEAVYSDPGLEPYLDRDSDGNPTGTINCCGCHGQHPGVPVLMCK